MLNLMQSSRVNPKLSAYAYLFGNFNVNATPLAPPGTKVVVYKKSGRHGSWQYHDIAGWAVGYSPNHYRCPQCFMPNTTMEIDADIVHLIPHSILLIPAFLDKDALEQAVMDTLHLLKQPSNTNIPTFWKGALIQNALSCIAKLLGRKNNQPTLITLLLQPVPPPGFHPISPPMIRPPGFLPLNQTPLQFQ
eukprot:14307816-Ditylum_brightwellii.AAC.2